MYENEKRLINLNSGITIVKKSNLDYLSCIEEIKKQGFKIKLQADKRYYYKTWISAIFNLYDSLVEELKNENFKILFDETKILELKKLVSKKYALENKKISLLDLLRRPRHKQSHPRNDETLETILIEFVNYDDIFALQDSIISLVEEAMEKVDEYVLVTLAIKNEMVKVQSAKIIDFMKNLRNHPKIKGNQNAKLIIENMIYIYEKMFIDSDVLEEDLIIEIEKKFKESLIKYKDNNIKALIEDEPKGKDVLLLTEEFISTDNEFNEIDIEEFCEKIRQLLIPSDQVWYNLSRWYDGSKTNSQNVIIRRQP